jgi:hypothetical protein
MDAFWIDCSFRECCMARNFIDWFSAMPHSAGPFKIYITLGLTSPVLFGIALAKHIFVFLMGGPKVLHSPCRDIC